MALVLKPYGLSPWRHLNGSSWNGATNVYFIPKSDTTYYTIGDAVKSVVAVATADNYDTTGIPNVTKATAGTAIRGVIVGVSPTRPGPNASLVGNSLSLESTAVPATKTAGWYVYVCDDPSVIFKIQMNNGIPTGGIALALCSSKNASLLVPAQTTGTLSTMVLDPTTIAVTAALELKILHFINGPENQGALGSDAIDLTVATGQYANVAVRINMHELAGAVAGTLGV